MTTQMNNQTMTYVPEQALTYVQAAMQALAQSQFQHEPHLQATIMYLNAFVNTCAYNQQPYNSYNQQPFSQQYASNKGGNAQ